MSTTLSQSHNNHQTFRLFATECLLLAVCVHVGSIFPGVDCGRRTINCICGFSNKEQDLEQRLAMQKHLEKVAQLKQQPVARVCLNIGMVAILLLGTFLYIFWSLWKYKPDDILTDSANITHYKQ